jgi:hypothetical protein
VPFVRFSRDKRGYENFFLMQPPARGKARPRLLYWFRTPPNVKVGRTPFDPEIRRALEAQNPDVAFDWVAIGRTPIPPADAERWRERRRAIRAMREGVETDEVEATASGRHVQTAIEAVPDGAELTAKPLSAQLSAQAEAAEPSQTSEDIEAGGATDARGTVAPARTRRRRRRRRRHVGAAGGLHTTTAENPAGGPDSPRPDGEDSSATPEES